MSDALLTRIADALEGLLAHVKGTPDSGVSTHVRPAETAAKGKGKGKAADPTPAAGATTPASPAPATTAASAAPALDPQTGGDLMTAAANAVIDLANTYSRDAALEELAKVRTAAGTPPTKVSQVTDPQQLSALLSNVRLRIEAEKAKKVNESLV